ncbi:MAG: hypothetical protein IT320_23690 [Anaerolineae bacterium]|nr:hypothetical protein [Anaerolineae bacterium]
MRAAKFSLVGILTGFALDLLTVKSKWIWRVRRVIMVALVLTTWLGERRRPRVTARTSL